MLLRTLSALGLVLLAALPAPAMGQDFVMPRTEYGDPDIQGTFTYRTLTPLNRPVELADKAALTAEEAEEWAAYERQRQNRDLIIDSVGGAGYPPGVISYNEFWYERGVQTIADRRTSLIYDPPTITKNGSVFIVSGANDSDSLVNVERVIFSDKKLALDLDGNAGLVAKLLGTVFGKDAVKVPEYVGIGLNLIDGGMSYSELMQLALNERLGAGFTNEAEVDLLFTNLAGSLPSATDRATFAGAIAAGQFTQVSLAIEASNHELSTTNINLVGLSETGLSWA